MTRNGDWTRYGGTPDPVKTDGRDIDAGISLLAGEAAEQSVDHTDRRLERIAPAPWKRVPAIGEGETTYYGRPLLKQSVWSVDIPLYYFAGGAAGAALTLGAALQFANPRGEHPFRRLSTICHWAGSAGSTIGAALLIHDLGRPSRFLYMMRVFRPTSPMNMGTWILSGAAPTAIFTTLFINRGGWVGSIAEATGYLSGIFGAALAGYTGVLVSNSAVPIWQEARRWVPVLFIASSAVSAASLIEVFADDRQSLRFAGMFGTAGRVAEFVAARRVERAASAIPPIAEPLNRGFSGFLWKAARGLNIASLGFGLLAGRSRRRAAVAGVLGLAGALCLRFAVHYATNASARDPKACFQQQNLRQESAD